MANNITSKVTSEDKALKAMIRKLKSVEDYYVEAGYYGEDKHPEHSESMAYLALANEEGVQGDPLSLGDIPPRPFLFNSFSINQGYQKQLTESFMVDYILGEGKRINQALKPFGEKYAMSITIAIEAGSYIPNADYTIEQKGFDSPLMETGYMKDNPRYKIVKQFK